jgi:hypothetical protein
MPLRHQITATFLAAIALGSTVPAADAGTTAEDMVEVAAGNTRPFTHVAWLPESADISSIKFEGIRTIKAATNLHETANSSYCRERSAEPGGSLYCPAITHESEVEAIEVRYSFNDRPMASDENGSTYYTFSVYFRPDEISSGLRLALSSGKFARTSSSDYLKVRTSRDSIRGTEIDRVNSTPCPGNYRDGNWISTNPRCEDRVAYREVPGHSPYIKVEVEVSQYEKAALTRESRHE